MVKKTLIAAILIVILVSATAYIAYTQFYNAPSSDTPAGGSSNKNPSSSSDGTSSDSSTTHKSSSTSKGSSSSTDTDTIIDGAGRLVYLPPEIKRIVVLDGNLAEMLCYMGLQSSIVGRTDAQCPPQLANVKSVGPYTFALNLELIIELNPDIIIADSLILYHDYTGGAYQKLTEAGLSIYVSQPPTSAQNPLQMTSTELYNAPTGIDVVCSVMQDLATVTNADQKRVDDFVTWAQYYNKVVKDSIATLPREKQTLSFVERGANYYTTINLNLYQAGGINIAENITTPSAEFGKEGIIDKNPAVFITLISSPTHDVNDFIAARNEILSRPELQVVDAVKNERVYVCDYMALNGMRSIIGYLYYVKWIQPDLLNNLGIDPAAVATTLNRDYLGSNVADTFCYPR